MGRCYASWRMRRGGRSIFGFCIRAGDNGFLERITRIGRMACAHTGRIGDEMTYPASIDNFTAKVDDVDDVMAQDVNEMQTAIKAIETELGTDPAGSGTDGKTRLSTAISDAGYLKFQEQNNLTISSGAITLSRKLPSGETGGAAGRDNPDTIKCAETGDAL